MKNLAIILLSTFLGLQTVSGADTYKNPILDVNLPDPTVMRDDDGMYYMTGTENMANLPLYRSADLVEWHQVGTIFKDGDSRPSTQLWAPELCRINGKYVLFYCSNPDPGDTYKAYIGYAVADNILGPWRDRGILFDGYAAQCRDTIDPFYFCEDGRHYLFWGSTNKMWAMEINVDDNLDISFDLSRKVQTAGINMEGTAVYKRGDWYYLFASRGSYAWTTYSVVVGRSDNLFGPYHTKEGISFLAGGQLDTSDYNLAKAEPLTSNNDRFTGTGHNAPIITDGVGNTWLMCHGHYKGNELALFRVPLLGRLFWDGDGWPYLDGGSMTPEDSNPAPFFPEHNATGADDGVESTLPVCEKGGIYDVYLLGDEGMAKLRSTPGITVNDYRNNNEYTAHYALGNAWWAADEVTSQVPSRTDGRDLQSFEIHGDWHNWWGGFYVARKKAEDSNIDSSIDLSHINADSRFHISFYSLGGVRFPFVEVRWFKQDSDDGYPKFTLADAARNGDSPVVGALPATGWSGVDISLGELAGLMDSKRMARDGVSALDYSRFKAGWTGQVLEISLPSGQDGDAASVANGHGAAACFDGVYVYTPKEVTSAVEETLADNQGIEICSDRIVATSRNASPIELYSIDGRMAACSVGSTLSLAGVPAGIYVVRTPVAVKKVLVGNQL